MSLISFVLPIFNEENNLPRLWEELQILEEKVTAMDSKDTLSCEYIFVNDGSKDGSMQKLTELFEANRTKVKVINFSRNHGHQIAVSAGQDYSKGDAVIIMDTDLQDPPETCLDLITEWQKGFDIVYAQRSHYKSNFIKQTCAWVFYRTLKKIASVDIPVDTGDFRLISKRVNLEMQKYGEKAKYLRGISSLVGFSQSCVQFRRNDRFAGKTGYTFWKSFKLALDGITGFSVFPLQIISILGVLFAVLSFVFGVGYIIYSLFHGNTTGGWASLMFTIIFMGSIQMIMLGLIGEYVGRIYIQSLDRPLYTIDNILENDKIVK
jgi:polyisoprenyl-phosphate glycosyltransferase